MSPAQRRLLELIDRETVDIRQAAERLGTTVFGISNTRTTLRNVGWVRDWKLWQGPIEITDEGREALRNSR